MTIEEAIKTALEYEIKVRDVYANGLNRVSGPEAKRLLNILVKEEQQHIEYLQSKLTEWENTGKITVDELSTALPSRDKIAQGVEKLEAQMSDRQSPGQNEEIQLLQNALDTEFETSNFYKRMVSELEGEGQRMFARFVEIEEGHEAIVQAQIDSLTGMGFWFGLQEFDLETG